MHTIFLLLLLPKWTNYPVYAESDVTKIGALFYVLA